MSQFCNRIRKFSQFGKIIMLYCKFATSPDILVAKRENLVTNVTVLVASSSTASEWTILGKELCLMLGDCTEDEGGNFLSVDRPLLVNNIGVVIGL